MYIKKNQYEYVLIRFHSKNFVFEHFKHNKQLAAEVVYIYTYIYILYMHI